jgi:hypothetical protein
VNARGLESGTHARGLALSPNLPKIIWTPVYCRTGFSGQKLSPCRLCPSILLDRTASRLTNGRIKI